MDNPVVFGTALVLFAASLFNFLAWTELHRGLWASMDFGDHLARGGIALTFAAVSVGSVLLMLNVGVAWRLPLVTLACVGASIGLARDLHRKGRR